MVLLGVGNGFKPNLFKQGLEAVLAMDASEQTAMKQMRQVCHENGGFVDGVPSRPPSLRRMEGGEWERISP